MPMDSLKTFHVCMAYDLEEEDWCWYYIPETDEDVICQLPPPMEVEFNNAIVLYHWWHVPEDKQFQGDLMLMVIEDIERKAWNGTPVE